MFARFRLLCVLLAAFALVAAVPSLQAAFPGASSPEVGPSNEGDRILQTTVLVLETTDTTTSIRQALTNLGVPFDVINSIDWTVIDFSPYDTVIVGMDGGLISEASVQAIRTGIIDAGKRACFVGGSAVVEFATGVNNNLIGIDIGNFNWTVSAAPHFTVTDPAHPLAQGLTSPTTFVNSSAAYYMARLTDADMDVVAVNGDAYPCLVFKGSNFPGGGSGEFLWFTSSAGGGYWTDPGDLDFLQQVVANFLADPVPVELQSLTTE